MRIDEFLADMGVGTRNEVKQLPEKDLVDVNEQVIRSPRTHIEPENDKISARGELVEYVENVYIMLNEPKGYISTIEDHHSKIVTNLIPEYQHSNIFPAGRLGKDTEGLLLITNDGDFNHKLMSPSKRVSKEYKVISASPITEEDIQVSEEGITLSDGKVKPTILTYTDNQTSHITIYERKYHQVKRIFHSIQNEVLHLRHIKITDLELDSSSNSGEYRLLTENDFDRSDYK